MWLMLGWARRQVNEYGPKTDSLTVCGIIFLKRLLTVSDVQLSDAQRFFTSSLKHSAISFKLMPQSTGGIPRLFIYS